MFSSLSSDQRAAALRARGVGALPVCHGPGHVAQRGRPECDGKAGLCSKIKLHAALHEKANQSIPDVSDLNRLLVNLD